jgi:predicted DNA-binding transcriptional regulator AlpA
MPPELTARRLVATPAAAAYAGMSASTFNKLRLTGNGPRYAKINMAVRYDLADVDDWLARKKRQSTSEQTSAPERSPIKRQIGQAPRRMGARAKAGDRSPALAEA